MLQSLLESAGFGDVQAITESTRFMSTWREADPDLILLDLRMPGVDGFEILEFLRCASEPPPVLVLTGDLSTESRNRALALGAKDFVSKPYDVEELVLRCRNLLETRSLHNQLRQLNQNLEQAVSDRTRELWLAVQGVEMSEIGLRRAREQTVLKLALAAELKDDETPAHVARFSRYCEIIADRAGLDKETCSLIRLASVLHDVGKIGVPKRILTSVRRLTDEERYVMQGHAEIGHGILTGTDVELLNLGASIALTHHERQDGSGYPNGLVGSAIPLEGRIAGIADVFDALTTDRVYRRRFNLPIALNMMRDGSGNKFDRELLDVFFDSIDEILKVQEEWPDVAP